VGGFGLVLRVVGAAVVAVVVVAVAVVTGLLKKMLYNVFASSSTYDVPGVDFKKE
jgi:hypothetical protein